MGDYVVTPEDRPEAAQYHWSSQMEVRVDPDLLEHLKEEPVKVLTSCLDDRKKHEAYRDAMLPWAKGKVSIFFSSEYYLEHVMEGVSKGAAIRWLCRYLHVPIEQTIGAGDAENDLSMLDAAGFAVCMEKRHPGGEKNTRIILPGVTTTRAVWRKSLKNSCKTTRFLANFM